MPRQVGAILHSPLLYDAIVWLALRGRERRMRRRLLDLSHLRSGESVLDVGCGTGTLAILAKETVGQSGTVCAVDPSREMLIRARAKAARAGAEIRFENAAAQALPFEASSFDVALSTIMLHHLGRLARRELAAELRRVVRPGGRVLLVDFAGPAAKHRGMAAHFRHRRGHVDLAEIVGLLESAGFHAIESGAVGLKNMHFALARAPAPMESAGGGARR
ncbi:MAG: class I SAM-dependent methyltransferase [Steroidobacteraceae bacterium]